MNNGVLDGLAPALWRKFDPYIVGFSAAGTGITQPDLGNATTYGEYWTTGQGRVMYRGSIQFGSTSTYGSGESVWGIRLPVSASRSSGGADLPIGNAWLWQGGAVDPQLNMVGMPTLMDPLLPGGNQTREDDFFQIFLSYLIAYGNGAFTSGSSTATITHGLGETPAAYDIQVTPTNNPSTAPKLIWVENITSTTFDVRVTTTATTTPVAFGWKIRAEPNSSVAFALLAGHLKPWVWASGHSISWQIEYEARR